MVLGLEKTVHQDKSADVQTATWSRVSSENQAGNVIKVGEHRLYGGPEGAASDPHLWIIDPVKDPATGMLKGFGINQNGRPIEYMINPEPKN